MISSQSTVLSPANNSSNLPSTHMTCSLPFHDIPVNTALTTYTLFSPSKLLAIIQRQLNMTTGSQPPPPLAPKPGRVLAFRAMYDYAPQNDPDTAGRSDLLPLCEGDVIYVREEELEKAESVGWLWATCKGGDGMVPANYVSESSETLPQPLHDAARRRNLPAVNECLAAGVSVNSLDKSGSTPIYWAAHSGAADVLQVLLRLPNANIHAQNKLGDTALHAAAWKGHADCAAQLLAAGAQCHTRNKDGKTAAQLASSPEVAAAINRVSVDQRTAAAEAADYLDSEPDDD